MQSRNRLGESRIRDWTFNIDPETNRSLKETFLHDSTLDVILVSTLTYIYMKDYYKVFHFLKIHF
jgi:hypothetical protein